MPSVLHFREHRHKYPNFKAPPQTFHRYAHRIPWIKLTSNNKIILTLQYEIYWDSPACLLYARLLVHYAAYANSRRFLLSPFAVVPTVPTDMTCTLTAWIGQTNADLYEREMMSSTDLSRSFTCSYQVSPIHLNAITFGCQLPEHGRIS